MLFEICRTSVNIGPVGRCEEMVGGSRPCEEATWNGTDWLLKLATLEDLVAFCRKYDQIVISTDGDVPEIEIYDNYRE